MNEFCCAKYETQRCANRDINTWTEGIPNERKEAKMVKEKEKERVSVWQREKDWAKT